MSERICDENCECDCHLFVGGSGKICPKCSEEESNCENFDEGDTQVAPKEEEFDLSQELVTLFPNGIKFVREDKIKEFIRRLKAKKVYGSGDWGGGDVVKVDDINKFSGELGK